MRPWLSIRRSALIAGVALVALALGAPGCGRPPDEAWLRFLGFRDSGGTTSLASLSGNLLDGTTDGRDAAFRNDSTTLSTTSGSTGIGIFIKSAHVDYTLKGFSPPAADYPLSLYLPASSVASDVLTATEGTLAAFPLASATLKNWLVQTHAFDDPLLTPAIDLTARVTFYAVSDDGLELQTAGGIAITLLNQ